MRTEKNAAWLLAILFCLSAATFVAALHVQGQLLDPQEGQQPTQPRQAEQLETERFPVVDFAAPLPTDQNERIKRAAKSKKYDSRYAPRLAESTDQIYSSVDWDVGLPALPVARSAAVIIGEITEAQAHLSDDQTAIYSEFAIAVDDVLKSDSRIILAPGKSVTAERVGGRVRFPSGKIAVSVINHQQMPRVGSRYVLFLTHDFLMGGKYSQDFFILTGYELRDGRVFPLDKTPPGHPITAYTGTGETPFFTDLSQILANSSSSQLRRF